MKNNLKLQLYIFSIFFTLLSNAQVGINTTTPDASSILEINSTDKGILIPRMDTTARNSITNPANGLLIYNTDDNEFQFNSNTSVSPTWTVFPSTTSGGGGESIKYSNTDTTTNLNSASAINAPLVGNLEWNDSSTIYTPNTTNNTITVNEAGRYKIIVNIPLVTLSNTDNQAPEIRIAIDGTAVGTYSSTGFLRTASGHLESSLHITEVLAITAGQVVSVDAMQSAASSTVTIRAANSASIYIEKLQ